MTEKASCRDNSDEPRVQEVLLYCAYNYEAQVLSDRATDVPSLLGYQAVSRHHQAQVPYVVYETKIDMCPVLDCMRYCCGTKKFMMLCPYMT